MRLVAIVLVLVGLTAALFAAACGGGGEDVATQTPGDAPPTLVRPSETPGSPKPTEDTRCSGGGGVFSHPIIVVGAEGGVVEEITGYQRFIWSPVGAVLALIDGGGAEGCPPVGRLDVIDLGTREVREVVEGSSPEVVWSPDGTRLAFTTLVPGHPSLTSDLRVVDLQGEVITLFEGNFRQLKWSPEADRIAFVRSLENGAESKLVIGTTGGEESEIYAPPEGGIGWYAWSPDGEWMAYTVVREDFKGNPVDYELWVAPAEGGVSTKVFSAADTVRVPKWSPDGGTILFDVSRFDGGEVYSVDPGGGADAVRLAEGLHAEWSPDGEAIAFIASWCETFDVAVMAADGTGQTNLTSTLPGLKTDVVWSPVGDRIAFPYYGSEEGRGLYTVGRDGSGPVRVAAVLEAIGWSADGEYIAGVEPLGRSFCV